MSEATAAQIERREPLMKIRGLTKEFKIKSRKLGAEASNPACVERCVAGCVRRRDAGYHR